MEELQRRLKQRHMLMIAMGGSIGTGIFLGSGTAIHIAGPGGAIVSYLAIGVVVYFLMTSLGEMATYLPVSGSFSTYASRFVDPALGFALGWNYWYSWAITIAAELSASSIIMKFWFPTIPGVIWSILFLLLIVGLNLLSVRGYGESEYWFSLAKVITIVIFIIIGVCMIVGIIGGGAVGFKNFTIAGAPFHGGFFSLLGIFMIAGFSFQGTELVGVAAGESEDPEKSIPIAIRQVFWRIILFYVCAIAVISFLIPYTDPHLAYQELSHISVSPFTLIFEKVGIAFAASIMNAVILTSILSAGNSGMYAATRILWVLGREGKAFSFLSSVNKRGVPTYALFFTTLVGMVAFLSSFFEDGVVYVWLLNASGLTGFIAWLGIALSHYRFRKAYVKQGKDLSKLIYRARWFPFGPVLSCVMCIIVIVGQNYMAFIGDGGVMWHEVLISYLGIPVFLILWLGYKFFYKTKLVPLDKVNLNTTSEEI